MSKVGSDESPITKALLESLLQEVDVCMLWIAKDILKQERSSNEDNQYSIENKI